MKTWVEISKQNLFHNLREITKNLKPETRFMATLKSNAYGHGFREIAKLLIEFLDSKSQILNSNKLWFGVDSIEEALALQKIPGANKIPTLILGYVPRASLSLVSQNVRLTIYNFETIKTLSAIKKKFKVHIKIETGTQRQGIAPQNLPNLIKAIKQSGNIEVEGISSHFAEAENIKLNSPIRANWRIKNVDLSSSFTKKQLQIFRGASILAEKLVGRKLIKHIACSVAASHAQESQCDMVRVGINLYGLQSITRIKNQSFDKAKILLNLKPVLSWKTIVAQIKNVKKRTPIGYGLTEEMPYNGRVAILPIGYWDGYDRRLSSRGETIIAGRRCKIIGRVCMNMCMVLLPRGLKIKIESEAILIGKQGQQKITVDELAGKLGTINYEVVTRINPMIPRIVI